MKTLVFLSILAVSACLAGNALSVGGVEPPSEYNAHWRLIKDEGVGCVRDNMFIYGSNDSTTMMYVGQKINLCGYDGVMMTIAYSLETADDGDYALVCLYDGTYYRNHELEGNTDGVTALTTALDDFYGCKDLGISIGWYSDETGVAKGIRIYTISLDGYNWGEDRGVTNIFTWDATEDVTGRQTFFVSGLPEGLNMSCLSFEYGAEAGTDGWWAMDNVDLVVNGESVLPLQEGGYGVEGFEYGGWYQDQQGRSGMWEIDTDHAAGEMSGANWQCDSAAHPGWGYEARTYSPWFFVRDANAITVNFDTWYHPVGTGAYASLNCHYGKEQTLYSEVFEDLYDWQTSDYGDEVKQTSWGEIKASF